MKQPPKDIEKYAPHYSENKLLSKLKKVFRKVGENTAKSALMLYYLLQSPSVSKSDKVKICGALGYFILPTDLIMDFVPLAGYTDDMAAIMWAIHTVANNITPEIKAQAKGKLSEWFDNYNEKKIDKVI